MDFGKQIGLGHLKRVEVYIKKYINDDVLLVSKHFDKDLTNYNIKPIKNNDDFFNIINIYKPTEIIIDNYEFSYEDEKKLKKHFKNIILSVFDDNYKKHYCDKVINHNLCINKSKYPKNTPLHAITPLIREEFYDFDYKPKKNEIFISLGGSDAKGLTKEITDIFLKKGYLVNIITTTSNQNLKKI